MLSNTFYFNIIERIPKTEKWALKTLVGHKIMNDVIKATTAQNQTPGKLEWRMHELSAEGITIVETIEKHREPLPSMESIYLITPTEASVRALMSDFQSQNRTAYRAAHVYFTEACPENLFNIFAKSRASKFCNSCSEIYLSFIPLERQVFSLDKPDAFQYYYNPAKAADRSLEMEKMAEQIATLCSTLGEYPSIRYRS
ncbi:STXBP1 [Lepeophtheirus salmonis]|uniref:STXBP1 n=1 Tax=Lepeophtheirus salmonis TaxID=72036 RepID=A0A7R8CFD3_LEPSM|nr:STXBP1 [Lepeophtheirus salmonis]CAF2805299.1 STXBP1 [Lepeophtheirus salmonis]